MGAVLRDLGHQEAGIRGQSPQQPADVLLTDGHLGGELRQPTTGEGRLYRVRLAVPAQQMRHVAALAACRNEFTELPQHECSRRHVRVIRGDQAAFTAGGEILADVEAERVHRTDGAHGPAPVTGAVRLRGVLHHGDPVSGGDLGDPVHVGGQAVQVDHDDRLGPAADRGLQRRGSRLNVTGSMSTNTGTAMRWSGAVALPMKLRAGTMTSSPGSTPAAPSATDSAAVPLLTATQCSVPTNRAHSRSRPAISCSPDEAEVNRPDLSTRWTACSS